MKIIIRLETFLFAFPLLKQKKNYSTFFNKKGSNFSFQSILITQLT